MEFHEKLQELRKGKGLTQEELATALYVSRTAISKWESGRGYPSIDSLKAIATYFAVSVDDLLSGDQLLTIAQEDTRQKATRTLDLTFGLLDLSTALFLFLPWFGQRVDGVVQEVSLLHLTAINPFVRVLYLLVVGLLILTGILVILFSRCCSRFKTVLSMTMGGVGALLFILGSQPYAAAFLFVFLVIKGLLLLKK